MPIESNRGKKLNKEKIEDSSELDDEDIEYNPTVVKRSKVTGIVVGIVFGVIILVVITVVYSTSREDGISATDPSIPQTINSEGTQEVQTDLTAISRGEDTASGDDSGFSVGITDVSGDTVKQNTSKIVSDTFTTDLNGKPVDEFYEIGSINSVIDFISYTKKRASLDSGVELYWLEGDYKGKKIKLQVPFKIFKELDTKGSTVVDVEVVTVYNKDGQESKIVTSMSVNPEYKKILQERLSQ